MRRRLTIAVLGVILSACGRPAQEAPAANAQPSTSATATRLEVICTDEAVTVEDAVVSAGPAGVEVRFTSPSVDDETRTWTWSYLTPDGGQGAGLEPDDETILVLPLHPGHASTVGCAPPHPADLGDAQWSTQVRVSDPGGVWRDTTLACSEVIGVSDALGGTAPRDAAPDLATGALTSYFDQVDASDVMQLGYPEASEPVFGVVRDGRVLARLQLTKTDAIHLVPNQFSYCDPGQW